MNVVLMAATGQAGLTILNELVSRGHHVKAVARHLDKIPSSPSDCVELVQDDLSNISRIAEIVSGADAVVSAYGPPKNDPRFVADVTYTNQLLEVTERLVEAVYGAEVPRLVVVGGCGSLEYSPGVTVLKSGYWPDKFVPIATSHLCTLYMLQASEINWTYFSPPMLIERGERTGKFRLGKDDLIKDSSGNSRVTFEDYAVALVDELENPAHERSRFTIGY